MPHEPGEGPPVGHTANGRARKVNPTTGRGASREPARGPLILTPFPAATQVPLSPQAAAVDRLRRAFNAVRDAQEMLERLVRSGPVTIRPRLRAPIDDLEWTASALSTALLALQDPAAPWLTASHTRAPVEGGTSPPVRRASGPLKSL
jgi:hypothetical protein